MSFFLTHLLPIGKELGLGHKSEVTSGKASKHLELSWAKERRQTGCLPSAPPLLLDHVRSPVSMGSYSPPPQGSQLQEAPGLHSLALPTPPIPSS